MCDRSCVKVWKRSKECWELTENNLDGNVLCLRKTRCGQVDLMGHSKHREAVKLESELVERRSYILVEQKVQTFHFLTLYKVVIIE
jgi:hypothetical protein